MTDPYDEHQEYLRNREEGQIYNTLLITDPMMNTKKNCLKMVVKNILNRFC